MFHFLKQNNGFFQNPMISCEIKLVDKPNDAIYRIYKITKTIYVELT